MSNVVILFSAYQSAKPTDKMIAEVMAVLTEFIGIIFSAIIFIGVCSFIKRAVRRYCGGDNVKRVKDDEK